MGVLSFLFLSTCRKENMGEVLSILLFGSFSFLFFFAGQQGDIDMPILIGGAPAQDLPRIQNLSTQEEEISPSQTQAGDTREAQSSSPEDLIFNKKFDQVRKSLNEFLARAPRAANLDHDLILQAFKSHLKEISPRYKCQRYEVIKTAAGWTVFLKNFIEDREKLSDSLYRAEWADFLSEIRDDNARRRAEYSQQKKEITREKELARRGFHSS
jgi:hypothetical protein